MQFIPATDKEHYKVAADLFREYAAWLGIDLCFQNFEKELLELEKMYGKPRGGIILVKEDAGKFIGCVGVRYQEPGVAELKRMYLKAQYQNRGIGQLLLEKALKLAADCGYKKIRLDTLNSMAPAMKLYRKKGFYEIPAYYHNPESTAVYFEKEL
ncbi:MAG: GNAT family N-acetyltransferase [Bacteroidetes bacterium]|nr:GNAT family N-acetyltransferase [Bacteroidota bacterium]